MFDDDDDDDDNDGDDDDDFHIIFHHTEGSKCSGIFFIRVLFYQSDTEWSLIKEILASAGHRTTALQVTRIGDCRHWVRWPLWLATIVMLQQGLCH